MPPLASDPFAPQPGRIPRVPFWLYLVVLLLFAGVVILQRPLVADPQTLAKLKSGELIEPESFSIETILGKLLLVVRGTTGPVPVSPSASPTAVSADPAVTILQSIDEQAKTTESAQAIFRAAVMHGEFASPAEMTQRFEMLRPQLASDSKLHADISTVTALYSLAEYRRTTRVPGTDPTAPSSITTPAPPADPDVQALIDRHGWVGKLAASAPDEWVAAPKLAPGASGGSSVPMTTHSAVTTFRSDSFSDGIALVVIFAAFGSVIIIALLSGFVLLIVGAVMAASGRLPRYATPWRDDFPQLSPSMRSARVWLETFGLFVAGFLALLLVRDAIPYQRLGIDPLWFVLLSQWTLVLVLFWPVVRGMPWVMFRALVGWHRGRGLGRELAYGFLAYLAAIPVYFFFALLVVLLMFLYQAVTGQKTPPPSTDRLTGLASGGVLQLLMVILLASVWAPLVEETIFRGCVYRFLRGKGGSVVAVTLSSLAFAAMHGYMFQQLILVGVLGAVFAFMREQRGSLIPSMFAHALHNTVVFSLITLLVRFGGDM